MPDLHITCQFASPEQQARRIQEEREELFRILYERSFLYRPGNPFLLSSGQRSPVYLDGKKTTLGHPRAQFLIGDILFHMISPLSPEGVGGLTLGADPIGVSVSLVSGLYRQPIPSFVVRKTVKEHGTKNPIEGDLAPGSRIIVVEDVVTTGASGMKAVEACRAAGHQVLKVISLVDREEGGRSQFERAGVPFDALFLLKRFIEYDAEVRGIR
ncbi:MAG: orotate phosphoribosyltransferase [Leptospirales bacterium]